MVKNWPMHARFSALKVQSFALVHQPDSMIAIAQKHAIGVRDDFLSDASYPCVQRRQAHPNAVPRM